MKILYFLERPYSGKFNAARMLGNGVVTFLMFGLSILLGNSIALKYHDIKLDTQGQKKVIEEISSRGQDDSLVALWEMDRDFSEKNDSRLLKIMLSKDNPKINHALEIYFHRHPEAVFGISESDEQTLRYLDSILHLRRTNPAKELEEEVKLKPKFYSYVLGEDESITYLSENEINPAATKIFPDLRMAFDGSSKTLFYIPEEEKDASEKILKKKMGDVKNLVEYFGDIFVGDDSKKIKKISIRNGKVEEIEKEYTKKILEIYPIEGTRSLLLLQEEGDPLVVRTGDLTIDTDNTLLQQDAECLNKKYDLKRQVDNSTKFYFDWETDSLCFNGNFAIFLGNAGYKTRQTYIINHFFGKAYDYKYGDFNNDKSKELAVLFDDKIEVYSGRNLIKTVMLTEKNKTRFDKDDDLLWLYPERHF